MRLSCWNNTGIQSCYSIVTTTPPLLWTNKLKEINKTKQKNNNVTALTDGIISLPDTLYCFLSEFVQASNCFLYFLSSAKADTWKRNYRCKYRHSKCQWILLSYGARTSSIYQCCWLDQMVGLWDTQYHPVDVGMMSQWTHTGLQNENGGN